MIDFKKISNNLYSSLWIFSLLGGLLASCRMSILDSLDNNSEPGSSSALQVENPYFLCVPNSYQPETAIVTKVVDGDSIRVMIGDEFFDVRYVGIDAPEFGEGQNSAANAATGRNRELVEEKRIMLYRDVTNTDKYGRLLRYVFVNGIFVNRELVREGYAIAKSYPPDISCQHVINAD